MDHSFAALSPKGEEVAQASRGREETRREWYWSEGSTDGPVPRGFGLARTRYDGNVDVEALAEQGSGFVPATVERLRPGEPERPLLYLDALLKVRWAVPLQPPWQSHPRDPLREVLRRPAPVPLAPGGPSRSSRSASAR